MEFFEGPNPDNSPVDEIVEDGQMVDLTPIRDDQFDLDAFLRWEDDGGAIAGEDV